MDIREIVQNYAQQAGYTLEQIQSAIYRFAEADKPLHKMNHTLFIEMQKKNKEAFFYVINGGDVQATAADILSFSVYVNNKGINTAIYSSAAPRIGEVVSSLLGDVADVDEEETTIIEVDTEALIEKARRSR
jgi:sRNA-binding regulator protein Hfq